MSLGRGLAFVSLVGLVVAAPLAVLAAPARAESHCVVQVVGQETDGELLLGDPNCFESFGAAAASIAGVGLASVTGPELFGDASVQAALSQFTLGVHFDAFNGVGSSIAVVGSNCNGGYWNTSIAWSNRISSSWNGCPRLRHYDWANRSGASADTTGVGTTDNLPLIMSNRTESIAYLGS